VPPSKLDRMDDAKDEDAQMKQKRNPSFLPPI